MHSLQRKPGATPGTETPRCAQVVAQQLGRNAKEGTKDSTLFQYDSSTRIDIPDNIWQERLDRCGVGASEIKLFADEHQGENCSCPDQPTNQPITFCSCHRHRYYRTFSLEFSSTLQGILHSKPYNPILGEVFRCKYIHKDSKTTFLAEQVCHHPPITAVHMANSQKGFSLK